MILNDLPVREKPREKLLREGAEKLSNAEILAILLRTGSCGESALDLAARILAMDESGIRYLAGCAPEELRRIEGLGDAKICGILAAVELGRRIASTRRATAGKIAQADDIANMYMETMRYYEKEHFLCLLINSRGEIIEETEVSVGDISGTSANPREVFCRAIRRSAGCVAFLHNHPSGDPTPSDEDMKTTRRLDKAGKLLGIPVLDHIIIGEGSYFSMKANGLL